MSFQLSRVALLAAALVMAATRTSAAQRTELRVTVRDSLSGLPLAAVSIATDSGRTPIGVTDSSGSAVLRLGSVPRRLIFSKIGYVRGERALALSDTGRVDLALLMARTSVAIAGVEVEAKSIEVPLRLREFEQRREAEQQQPRNPPQLPRPSAMC